MVHLTVGSPVEGKDFYGRDELIKLIWERLERNNLLLAAPRTDKGQYLLKGCGNQFHHRTL